MNKEHETVEAILLILAILCGMFHFDGLSVVFGMMFCTSFIERAIKGD